MKASRPVLYYIHDPMCSWCWAFRPVWSELQIQLQAQLPNRLEIIYLLGGLAPDCDMPMPAETRTMIRRHWQTITQRVPGTVFNDAFWSECEPRRSTWPACRAVIAAAMQLPDDHDTMILAIQQAYYLQARNPSDDGVLIDLAVELGLDADRFRADLHAPETQTALDAQMQQVQQLGVQGFPSLVLKDGCGIRHIRIDYNDTDNMLQQLADLLSR
ncbi:MAG: DsbA family protein [Mariprofundus sp.]